MEIDIDLMQLNRLNLTANHYIALVHIYKEMDLPNCYKTYCNKLEEEQYIRIINEKKYLLEKAYREFFRKNYWYEFLNKFPYDTPNGDILHKNLNKAKKIFETEIGKDDAKFKFLMRYLTAEIEFRNIHGYEIYMYSIDNFLAKYIENGYGKDFIKWKIN